MVYVAVGRRGFVRDAKLELAYEVQTRQDRAN